MAVAPRARTLYANPVTRAICTVLAFPCGRDLPPSPCPVTCLSLVTRAVCTFPAGCALVCAVSAGACVAAASGVADVAGAVACAAGALARSRAAAAGGVAMVVAGAVVVVAGGRAIAATAV